MRDLISRVTVAICTHRRSDLLTSTLRCLVRQEYPADHYEVLVVDNAPEHEGTAQVVRQFQDKGVRIIYRACLTAGLSHARNAAVTHSESELIVFADDDIVCEPCWLRMLVAPFAGDPDRRIAAVGGEVIPVYSEGVHRGGVQIYRPLCLRKDPGPILRRQMLMGANMAFRRDALLNVGAFDTRVGRNGAGLLAGDENRPVERLRRQGREIWFVPSARVFHELPRCRTSLSYAMRHGFDSARSRVLTQTAALDEQHRSSTLYLWSRLLLNGCKLPALMLQAVILVLLLQRSAVAPVLVRIARTLGYELEAYRVLARKSAAYAEEAQHDSAPRHSPNVALAASTRPAMARASTT